MAPIEEVAQKKQITQGDIEYINDEFCPKLLELSGADLIVALNGYIDLIKKIEKINIFDKTESVLYSAIKASYNIDNLQELQKINLYINQLQELKRKQKKYHEEEKSEEACLSARSSGEIRSYIDEFAKSNWSEKTLSVLTLAKLALVDNNKDKIHIKIAAERASELLAHYADYLEVADLYVL